MRGGGNNKRLPNFFSREDVPHPQRFIYRAAYPRGARVDGLTRTNASGIYQGREYVWCQAILDQSLRVGLAFRVPSQDNNHIRPEGVSSPPHPAKNKAQGKERKYSASEATQAHAQTYAAGTELPHPSRLSSLSAKELLNTPADPVKLLLGDV